MALQDEESHDWRLQDEGGGGGGGDRRHVEVEVACIGGGGKCRCDTTTQINDILINNKSIL